MADRNLPALWNIWLSFMALVSSAMNSRLGPPASSPLSPINRTLNPALGLKLDLENPLSAPPSTLARVTFTRFLRPSQLWFCCSLRRTEVVVVSSYKISYYLCMLLLLNLGWLRVAALWWCDSPKTQCGMWTSGLTFGNPTKLRDRSRPVLQRFAWEINSNQTKATA